MDNWRSRTLRSLRKGGPVVLLGRDFAPGEVVDLCNRGVFRRGTLPDDGAELLLSYDGEFRPFNVIRIGNGYACYEHSDGSERAIDVEEEALRSFELKRDGFYALIADELGCEARVIEPTDGVWQVGTYPVPDRGKAMVVMVEPGVHPEEVEQIPALVQFKTVLILSTRLPKLLHQDPERIILAGVLAVDEASGLFETSLTADLTDTHIPEPNYAYVDVDAQPPLFRIHGKSIPLPTKPSGEPADGVTYLEHLFDHVRKPIECWELNCVTKPGLKEEVGEASWSEEALDETAKRNLVEAWEQKKIELDEVENKYTVPEEERAKVREEYEALGARLKADLGIGGRSREIAAGDRERARRRIRKAIGKVVSCIAKADPVLGHELKKSLGEGNPVTFCPPPDWGL